MDYRGNHRNSRARQLCWKHSNLDLDRFGPSCWQETPKCSQSWAIQAIVDLTGNTFGQLFAYMHCIDVAHKKPSTPNNIQGICHVREKKGTVMENPALRGSNQKSYEHSALSCWPWSHELTNDRLVAGPAHKQTIANTHTPKTKQTNKFRISSGGFISKQFLWFLSTFQQITTT